MSTQLSKFRLTTSFITGSSPCDKNIIKLKKEVDKGNKKFSALSEEMLKLNNYIKLIEDKLSCFFEVDDDFIIEGN